MSMPEKQIRSGQEEMPVATPVVSRAGARILQVDVDYGLDDRLLPIDAVMQIAGLGKTTIYGLMRKGKFPMACKPGGLSSRWSEREVNEWRDNLLAARPSISPKP